MQPATMQIDRLGNLEIEKKNNWGYIITKKNFKQTLLTAMRNLLASSVQSVILARKLDLEWQWPAYYAYCSVKQLCELSGTTLAIVVRQLFYESVLCG